MRRSLTPSLLLALLALACDSGSGSGKKKDATGGDSQGNDSGDSADSVDSNDGADSVADAGDDSVDGDDSADGGNDATDGGSDSVDGDDGACVGEPYSEPLPSQTASLAELTSSYSQANLEEFVLAVLGKRYPIGRHLVEGGLEYEGYDCIGQFLQDKGSAQAVIRGLPTVVHECGHLYDIDQGGFSGSVYVIREDLRYTCSGLAYSGPKKAFARSLLTDDEYSALRPPCGGSWGQGCDSYADIYLDGTPGGQFESGDQGFDSLLEETVQYVNSLATGYAFVDYAGGFSTSERDGISTFLWYVERYLRLARLEHPEVYEIITQDACWRDAILTVWDRANFYLDAARGDPALGIDDAAIWKLVQAPELLEEIDRIREAAGCK